MAVIQIDSNDFSIRQSLTHDFETPFRIPPQPKPTVSSLVTLNDCTTPNFTNQNQLYTSLHTPTPFFDFQTTFEAPLHSLAFLDTQAEESHHTHHYLSSQSSSEYSNLNEIEHHSESIDSSETHSEYPDLNELEAYHESQSNSSQIFLDSDEDVDSSLFIDDEARQAHVWHTQQNIHEDESLMNDNPQELDSEIEGSFDSPSTDSEINNPPPRRILRLLPPGDSDSDD